MSDQKKLAIIATKGTLDFAYPPLILATTAVALDYDGPEPNQLGQCPRTRVPVRREFRADFRARSERILGRRLLRSNAAASRGFGREFRDTRRHRVSA